MKKFDLKNRPSLWAMGLVCVLWVSGEAATPAPGPAADSGTITSDELDVIENGAKTLFTGHVVLIQGTYLLHADRMERTKTTGVVNGWGHIVGTWVKPTGEKIVAAGDRARYDPAPQTTEWWGHARLTRWVTEADTAPVVITAGHFTAYQADQTLLAETQVLIHQGTLYWTQSDEGKYEQKEQVMQLWGTHPTHLHWQDAKGYADFTSGRAWIYIASRKAHLVDHVKGHVVPSS